MPDWVNPATFIQLQVPTRMQAHVTPVNPEWSMVVLSPTEHPELYQYFMTGGRLLHRTSSRGAVELFALLEEMTPDQLRNAKWNMEVLHAENNRFIFGLVLRPAEGEPIHLPFAFDLTDPGHRYEAAALCEQPLLRIFLLERGENHLAVLSNFGFSWPDEAREALRGFVLGAYRPEENTEGRPGMGFRDAMSLTDDECLAAGWSYHYDLALLESRWGQEAVDRMHERVTAAVETLAGHSHPEMRQGPYVVWLAVREGIAGAGGEKAMGLVYLLSPSYPEGVQSGDLEAIPCHADLSALPGFIRCERAVPIWEGALPLLRYAEGSLDQVRYGPDFLARAAALHDRIRERQEQGAEVPGAYRDDRPNFYRYLLSEEES